MATLTNNSLDNCTSIPDFIPAGTRMVFSSTSAPPSWTKLTSHSNKALRLVTGTVTPAGATQFSSVFPASPKPVAGSINSVPSNATFGPETISSSTGLVNAFPTISINPRTIDDSHMAAHTHSYNRRNQGTNTADQPGNAAVSKDTLETIAFSPAGPEGGGSHNHSFPATPQHNHGVSASAHSHQSSSGPHLHGFTTTAQDFEIKYVDVIVCQKQ